MPLRAPAHLTPLPQLAASERPHPAIDEVDLRSAGSAFDTPRPVPLPVRPRLRDIGTESGEETAIAPGQLSGTLGAQPLAAPRSRPFSASVTPPELSRLMRAARRKRHLVWAIAAVVTVLVALLAYGVLAGG
jgi:hypothetical protein